MIGQIIHGQKVLNYKEDIINLDRLLFPQPWNDAQWQEVFANEQQYEVLLSLGEECQSLSAIILFSVSPIDSFAHLLKIVTLPDFRSRGVAQGLLSGAVSHLRGRGITNFYLEVAVDNKAAIGLYHKNGFKVLCEKKNFYSNGSSAFAMQRVYE